MNILNEKFDFMRSTNFKLLQRIKGHLINNCQFLFKSSYFLLGAAIVIARPGRQKCNSATILEFWYFVLAVLHSYRICFSVLLRYFRTTKGQQQNQCGACMMTHKRVLYNDYLVLMGPQVSSKSFNSAKLLHYVIIHHAEQQEISKDVSRKVSHFCSRVFGTMYCYSTTSFDVNLTKNNTTLTWHTSLVTKTLHLTQANCQLYNTIPNVWIRKTNQMSLFVFFISLLIVAQHVSGNHVPIIRS